MRKVSLFSALLVVWLASGSAAAGPSDEAGEPAASLPPSKVVADVVAPPPRTVEAEIAQLPPEPIPLNINMRMFCAVSENGRRFSVYVDNRNYGDRTCRASCSYRDRGQDGVLACSGTVPAQANRMVLCTKYGRHSKFVFTGEKKLACE